MGTMAAVPLLWRWWWRWRWNHKQSIRILSMLLSLLLPFKYLGSLYARTGSAWVSECKSVSKIHKIKRTFAHFQHFNCGIERNKKENTHSKQIETINRALAIKNSAEKKWRLFRTDTDFLCVFLWQRRTETEEEEASAWTAQKNTRNSHVEILCNHKRSKNTNFSFHCP